MLTAQPAEEGTIGEERRVAHVLDVGASDAALYGVHADTSERSQRAARHGTRAARGYGSWGGGCRLWC